MTSRSSLGKAFTFATIKIAPWKSSESGDSEKPNDMAVLIDIEFAILRCSKFRARHPLILSEPRAVEIQIRVCGKFTKIMVTVIFQRPGRNRFQSISVISTEGISTW